MYIRFLLSFRWLFGRGAPHRFAAGGGAPRRGRLGPSHTGEGVVFRCIPAQQLSGWRFVAATQSPPPPSASGTQPPRNGPFARQGRGSYRIYFVFFCAPAEKGSMMPNPPPDIMALTSLSLFFAKNVSVGCCSCTHTHAQRTHTHTHRKRKNENKTTVLRRRRSQVPRRVQRLPGGGGRGEPRPGLHPVLRVRGRHELLRPAADDDDRPGGCASPSRLHLPGGTPP